MVPQMVRIFWIALGGAIGTLARYFTGLGLQRWLGPSFPYATLAVNVVGSFILALVMSLALATTAFSLTARLALTTGFCGGLTTYSTFNYETQRFIEEGALGMAALNIGLTGVLCLGAGFAGSVAGRALSGLLTATQPAG